MQAILGLGIRQIDLRHIREIRSFTGILCAAKLVDQFLCSVNQHIMLVSERHIINNVNRLDSRDVQERIITDHAIFISIEIDFYLVSNIAFLLNIRSEMIFACVFLRVIDFTGSVDVLNACNHSALSWIFF